MYHLFLILLFVKFSFNSSIIIHEINEVIFLNPHTNSSIIQCPLDFIHSLDIEWYDVIKDQYELDRGRYYRINGLQPFNRELICSSVSQTDLQRDEIYRFKIRVYDRPLPIQHVSKSKITNTSLTLLWKDNTYNRNANITSYELILKHNNTIHYHILLNNTLTNYTFLFLHPNTLYSIDISVIDIWKRSSEYITIIGKTLSLNKTKLIFSHKIIDNYLLNQLISCYHINNNLLLIEFNHSNFLMFDYIYNLTIYNNQDKIILTDNLYSFQQQLPIIKTLYSFIYYIKEINIKYKIKLIISTIQSEYLGRIYKYCENFYPIYSPITCTIKKFYQNKYHLKIHIQLDNNKHIITLKPNYIFYQINQTYIIKKNIYDIHKYITVNISDVKENYTVIVENNLLGSNTNDKLNISILCPITRTTSIKQNNRISNSIIISVILLILSLTVFVCFMICQNRCLHYICLFRDNHRSKSNLVQINVNDLDINDQELDSISIPIDEFPLYVSHMHQDNDFGFIRLFEDICELTKLYKFPMDISQTEFNKSKNRYMNILPFDYSRVVLSSNNKYGIGNYINANYIDGNEKSNAYIATQAPLMNTIEDFWRMIWEKDVNVIVMITNIEEHEKIKWDVYWPQEGTEIYGNIQITLVNTISLAYYIKRIFKIRCKVNQEFIDNDRLIYQFHYIDWPDHSVPLFTLPVLTFIHHSSSCNSESNGPIVVHCSAGVGRTGTYIVIDTMLKKLNKQQSINIPSCIKQIRQQRNYLVQTEEQFIFIHDILLEAIHLINIGYNNLELNKQNFNSIINMLNSYDENSNITRIEKQFQLIIEQIEINNYQLLDKQIKEKHRIETILPLNSCRVLLSTDKKQINEGYINASYIHGYYRIDEFIITQHPMKNTIIDFWHMVWNTNADVIVSLYADEKLEFDVPDFWPLINEKIDCGSFNVCLINEYFEYEYIYRDFLLQSIEKTYQYKVKLISSSYWPETCSPIKTSFNLVNIIRNLNSNRPIIVHDLFGGHRAATFCALYTIMEQIEIEGRLNIYELAKMYYIKRPGVWRCNDDLLFLCQCAKILFNDK